jgi:hypothetical protein
MGLGFGTFVAALSLHCASRGSLGFELETDDGAATVPSPEAAPAPPGTFGSKEAGAEDSAPKPVDGCHIATLGINGFYPSDIFSTWLDKSGNKTTASLKDQVLTKALLSPYSMIVVLDVSQGHDYAPEEVDVLKQWVEAGGGLFTLTAFRGPPEPVNVNRLLVPYDMTYGDNLILNKGQGLTWPVTHWAPHPVTNGITSIGIGNGYPTHGSGTPLAGEEGWEVLRAKDVGAGHVLIWGDEWIMFNDQWTAHPEYQVQQLWQNIVDWFDPGAGCVVPPPPVPK